MKGFFEKYTETAAIEKVEFDAQVEVNADEVTCISSGSDCTATFYLRNPQSYELVFEYKMDNAASQALNVRPNVVLEQSEDTKILYVSLAKDFLTQIDCSVKDISGSISLVEKTTARKFDSYNLKLNVDSVPPAVKSACYQLSSSGSDGKYIVCFFLPDVDYAGADANMAVHKNDTRKIYVDDQLLYFNGGKIYKSATLNKTTGVWDFADEDARFVYTPPAGMTSVSESGGFDFTSVVCPAGYSPVYFLTGKSPSANGDECSVKIEDDAGLSNTVRISNKSKQLTSPVLKDVETLAAGVMTDEDTGLYVVELTHDGMCTDGSEAGESKITYTAYDFVTDAVIRTGSGEGSVKLGLPRGKYRIEATASRNYYIESETYNSADADVVGGIVVKSPAVFYVSNTGDNQEGLGSKRSPYRSIQKAVNVYDAGVTAGDYDAAVGCSIRILSDITPCEDDLFESASQYALIYFKKTYTYSIEGVGDKWRIDVGGSEATGSRRILSNDVNISETTPMKVSMSNLILSGGYFNGTYGGGGAAYINASYYGSLDFSFTDVTFENNTSTIIGGGAVTVNSGYKNTHTVTFTDCLIQNNTASGDGLKGGGIYYYMAPSASPFSYVYLKGKTVIKDNICEGTGGGVYAASRLFIDGEDVKITDNKAKVAGGVYVDGENGELHLKGPVTVTGNTSTETNSKSNVFMASNGNGANATKRVAFIEGDITGSKIGFAIPAYPETVEDAVCITSGYGYGTKNKSLPGTIFSCDDNYGVTYNDDNEVIVSLSGGSVAVEENDVLQISTPRLNLNEAYRTMPFTVWDTVTGSEATEESTFSFKVICGTDDVPASYYSTDKNKLTFADSFPTGNYRVVATAVCGGKKVVSEYMVSFEKGDDLSAFDVVSDGETFNAEGDYYLNSSSSLNALANMQVTVATGKTATFNIADDIVLEADYAAGTKSNVIIPQGVTVDGHGHTVSGLTASSDALFKKLGGTVKNLNVEGEATYAGLVKDLAANAVVEDCNVNVNITNTGIGGNFGGVASSAASNVTVKGCVYEGSINSTQESDCYVGGIVGKIDSASNVVITECENKGSVTSLATGTGGVIGSCSGNFSNKTKVISCVNSGTVSGNKESGGILGYGENVEILSCTNVGNVNSSGCRVAGIIGRIDVGTSVVNCKNTGDVTASSYAVGGIAGEVNASKSNNSTLFINGCENYGNVTGSQNVGGIFGSGSLRILNCINGGTVTGLQYSAYGTVGGIAGYVGDCCSSLPDCSAWNLNASIINCLNYGEVIAKSANEYAAGIVSFFGGSYSSSYNFSKMMNCVNVGTITVKTDGYKKNILKKCENTRTYIQAEYSYFLGDEGTEETESTDEGTKTIIINLHPFKKESNKYTTHQQLTVGTTTSSDVVELLNAWIDTKTAEDSNYSIFRKWKYNESGLPTFAE